MSTSDISTDHAGAGPRDRRKPGRPSGKQQSPDLEARLVDAALQAFGAKGFDGASLSQIAALAEADVALIRYYFGSKQGLWNSSLEFLVTQLSAELADILTEEPAKLNADQLKSAIRWFVDMSARYPSLSRIIVHDGDDEGTRGAYIANDLIGPFYEIMAALIDGAKREGAIPDVATRTIFFMITHGGSFPMALPVLTNAFPGGKIGSKRALRAHADAIIALVMREGRNS